MTSLLDSLVTRVDYDLIEKKYASCNSCTYKIKKNGYTKKNQRKSLNRNFFQVKNIRFSV